MVKNHAASDLDNLLAEIFALEQTKKCFRGIGQTHSHGFAWFEFSRTDQFAKFFQSHRPIGGMFTDDKALNLHAVDQYQRGIGHGDGVAVIARNHAAYRDAAEMVHAQHDGVKHHAAHIFKMPIDAVGTHVLECFGQGQIIAVLFVIYASVKTEFMGDVIAFVFSTGDTDHTTMMRTKPCHAVTPGMPTAPK